MQKPRGKVDALLCGRGKVQEVVDCGAAVTGLLVEDCADLADSFVFGRLGGRAVE